MKMEELFGLPFGDETQTYLKVPKYLFVDGELGPFCELYKCRGPGTCPSLLDFQMHGPFHVGKIGALGARPQLRRRE
jgi:hypothetical protein